MPTPSRFPVYLVDGPRRRATALRPVLDDAGWPSACLNGDPPSPALVLVDPDRPEAEHFLDRATDQVRVTLVPHDARMLLEWLDAASRGLGIPAPEHAIELAACARALADAETLLDLARVSAAHAQVLTAAAKARLFLIEPQSGDLISSCAAGSAPDPGERRIDKGRRVEGWVTRRGLPVLIDDFQPDAVKPRTPRPASEARMLAAAPIFLRGHVAGVLEVEGAPSQRLAERELQLLTAIAPHVSAALDRLSEKRRAQVRLATRAHPMVLPADLLEAEVSRRTEVIARGKREWERTFDSIQDPICLLEGFTIQRANKAFAALVDRPVTQVVGETCHRLRGHESPCPGCPLAKDPRGREGEIAHGALTLAVTAHSVGDGRTVVHYRDVTRERALEQRLRQRDRLSAVHQLAAGAAHEINNPIAFVTSNLGSLRGYVDELAIAATRLGDLAILAEQGRGDEAAAGLKLASSDSLRRSASATIEDSMLLLDECQIGLSRVAEIVSALKELSPGGGVETQADTLSVLDLLDAALRPLHAQFPEVQITWSYRDAGQTVGRAKELQRAFGEVLKNACQAHNGREGNVSVSCEDLGADIRVRVVDDGCGVPSKFAVKIFEPFFTTRGVGQGLGLGLSTAYGIVNGHGGRIELRSPPGGGTEVEMVLPSSTHAIALPD